MSTRPAKAKRASLPAEGLRVRKEFEEVAERIFRDDSPAEPLYGAILQDDPAENAA